MNTKEFRMRTITLLKLGYIETKFDQKHGQMVRITYSGNELLNNWKNNNIFFHNKHIIQDMEAYRIMLEELRK